MARVAIVRVKIRAKTGAKIKAKARAKRRVKTMFLCLMKVRIVLDVEQSLRA